MKNKKIIVLALLSVVSASFYFYTQPKRAANEPLQSSEQKQESKTYELNPYHQLIAQSYDSAFQKLMERHHVPGAAVVILHDTTIVLLKGYGVKENGTVDSVDTHTVFRLASVSKPFASFLTGILVEEGELHWNDTVKQLWPGFALQSAEQAKQITINHVLSHTTGLPYHTYTNMIEEGLPFDTLLAYLRDVRLVSKPGELYSYQNVGYSIIGKAIEQATGKTYQQQLKEKVFVPLHMDDASTDYMGLLGSGNMAQPHIFKRGMLRPTLVNDTYYNVSPAGGVNASIDDMSKWLRAMLGNKQNIIHHATLDSITKPRVLANSRNRNFYKWNRVKQAYYAMGWRVLRFSSDTLVYHGGYVAGYRSEVAILRNEKIAICVLSNAPGPLADNSLPVFLEIFDRYRYQMNGWKPLTTDRPNL